MSAEIEEAVWETLEAILLSSRENWRATDNLVKDLKVDSDDLSFILRQSLRRR